MNPQLPASQQAQPSNVNDDFFVVLSQDGYIATLDNRSGVLVEGSLLSFTKPKASGVVVSLNGTTAVARLSTTLPCRHAQLVRVCSAEPPKFHFYRLGLSQIGELDVACLVPGSHQPGQIGWSLYYVSLTSGKEEPIVDGHDYHTPAHCSTMGTAVWQPGSYRLAATYYSLPDFSPRQTKQVRWTLTKESPALTAGRLNDTYSRLVFR